MLWSCNISYIFIFQMCAVFLYIYNKDVEYLFQMILKLQE